MEVQQDVALHDTISLVDSEDAWELAEMSGRRIVTQQDVTVRADSEDRREVAEMSGSRTTVGDVHDMITLMDSEDLREAEMSGSCPVTTRVRADIPHAPESTSPFHLALTNTPHIHSSFTLNCQFRRYICPPSKDLSGTACGRICTSCQGIMSNLLYEGIIGHIESGIHVLESICCCT
jgi:hypothetical protein